MLTQPCNVSSFRSIGILRLPSERPDGPPLNAGDYITVDVLRATAATLFSEQVERTSISDFVEKYGYTSVATPQKQ